MPWELALAEKGPIRGDYHQSAVANEAVGIGFSRIDLTPAERFNWIYSNRRAVHALGEENKTWAPRDDQKKHAYSFCSLPDQFFTLPEKSSNANTRGSDECGGYCTLIRHTLFKCQGSIGIAARTEYRAGQRHGRPAAGPIAADGAFTENITLCCIEVP